MKKLYYFSKPKLQFVEITNYKSKLVIYFAASVLVISSIIFGSFYVINSVVNSSQSYTALKAENKELKSNLDKMIGQYKKLNIELNKLAKSNNVLRLAANLDPVSGDVSQVGIGGGSFDNSMDFLTNPDEEKLKSAISFVDEISRKIDFEKNQFIEISNKLKENKKLYEDIPAIEPCNGTIGDGFGMRMHPILHIERMHDGIDFVTNEGTPVYVTGDGTVDFTGVKEGFGIVVEVNHGFGYTTVYAHLSKILVKDGQKVKRGQEIALTGDTGLSTGPHLHYEVHHDGVALDPQEFFFGNLGFFELTKRTNN